MHPGELLRSSTAAAASVALGSSPATYLATQRGTLYVAGGTVTAIALGRAGISSTLGITSGGVHMRTGDTVTVTYAVIPTATTFVPD